MSTTTSASTNLPHRRGLTEQVSDAAAEQMFYRGFLAELSMAECDERALRCAARRIKGAGFLRDKSLRARDFANPHIDAVTVRTLAKCELVKTGREQFTSLD